MTDVQQQTEIQQPVFARISDLFLRHGCLHAPAELHGDLCGQLCAGQIPDLDTWLRQAMQFMDVAELDSDESKVELAELLEQTEAGIKDQDLGFKLLIADEDFSLNERMQTLLEWCEGFLSALGDNQTFKEGKLSTDLKEALQDLEQIAEMSEPLDDDEQNEKDLFAVSEYVRMTAMMLYTECNPTAPQLDEAAQEAKTLQ
ncbi:UPF0149 family protein [Oceanospirillum sp.]|uniref:UPF0149 family protein n=1 Tax=Oceanospirillum sp. TaxID=2021254 RepID=UPI003A957ED4